MQFLGVFPKLCKATVSFIMSVCLSVRLEQISSHMTHFREILYLSMFLRNLLRKFKLH